MRNKVLVLVMVCSLITCSGNLMAKERRGADLVITRTDGQEIKGELIAVKPSALLLLDSQTGADVSVEIGQIAIIKIIKKSKALLIGGISFGVGVSLGLVGLVSGEGPEDAERAYSLAALLGGLFGIAGAGIGATFGKDETIELSGDPERIKTILERLRSKARIKNYQ